MNFQIRFSVLYVFYDLGSPRGLLSIGKEQRFYLRKRNTEKNGLPRTMISLPLVLLGSFKGRLARLLGRFGRRPFIILTHFSYHVQKKWACAEEEEASRICFRVPLSEPSYGVELQIWLAKAT